MLDRLTLDQLRVLIAVAETGSFSAAARRLGRVQSSVSQTAQSLEDTLGIALFDRTSKAPKLTEAGQVLLVDARAVVGGADMLRAHAQSIGADIEPELALAVDQVFPKSVLMDGLKALTRPFPQMPVTLFTEGMGAPEQRLRDGAVSLAIYWPHTPVAGLEVEFLASIPLIPVVAADHPLASETAPLVRSVLERHVQLVWTDRTPVTSGISGGIISTRLWRFDDLSSRLEYLLAGFGWCTMPQHLVDGHIAAGRLKRLVLKEHGGRTFSYPLYIVHKRGRPPGRAGRWLLEQIRKQLPQEHGLLASRELVAPTVIGGRRRGPARRAD